MTGDRCLRREGALLPDWVLQVIVLLGFIYVHLFFPLMSDTV